MLFEIFILSIVVAALCALFKSFVGERICFKSIEGKHKLWPELIKKLSALHCKLLEDFYTRR
jgi:hypothetical protein